MSLISTTRSSPLAVSSAPPFHCEECRNLVRAIGAPGRRSEQQHYSTDSWAFAEMAKALTSPTLAENGCRFFEFWADLDNTGRFTALESWESEQHLEEHRNTPHVAEFREASADLGLESMDIRRYPVSGP